ncbi:unknown [Prevotella sp. CAG:5226]|nr:unknown [Prevotella sp. CAG:5226]
MNQRLSYMKTMFYSIKIKLLLLHTEQKKQTIQFQIVSQRLERVLFTIATLSPT